MAGSFHKSLVAIAPVASEKKIFMGISHRVLCSAKFGCGGHLDLRAETPKNINFFKWPKLLYFKPESAQI
jgi:hypothetical protein